MPRHSFIQMSKLPNVKGRISYITSHARQENLYATYRTADSTFWSNLARESPAGVSAQRHRGQMYRSKGTDYRLARNLYAIRAAAGTHGTLQRSSAGGTVWSACPPSTTTSARTNYHIHLIFSERRLLPEPDVKVASRSVFFDETGKRVRTKKEITGEDGQIRKGCTVIKKRRGIRKPSVYYQRYTL